jgi:hypothetical protein
MRKKSSLRFTTTTKIVATKKERNMLTIKEKLKIVEKSMLTCKMKI